MIKHTDKQAYFERLKDLADVNKPTVKESKARNLGSLIDYKRAPDGVAYGIVKENHNYYLKKAGTKQDPDVADFAYIGGLGNIKNFQYKSLAEADKQRNMIFHTINEAVSLRPDKNGGGKKKKLNEDKASDEIEQAASKVGDLDAATSAEKVPPVAPEGGAEMAAGLEAKPEGSEETPAPAPDGGEGEAPAGAETPVPDVSAGEETPPADGETPVGDAGEETPAPDVSAGEETPPADGETPAGDAVAPEGTDEPNTEIEKTIGKLTNKIRKTEMEDAQVKSYINSFLVAFRDKLRDIDIEDRKEMANKILKVVGPEEIDDLEASMPSDEPEASGVEEEQCAECGSFGKYAESMGYSTAESLMECDEEEVSNLVSGYANAHNDGMNDGDLENVALVIKVINPEILNKLKGDYGHEDYANKLTPYVDGMSECSQEEGVAKLNELWGGIGALGKAAGSAIGSGVKKAGQAVGGAIQKGVQAVGQAGQNVKQAVAQKAQDIKQTYYTGEKNAALKKLETDAMNLGKQIATVNAHAVKAGEQPINVNSLLTVLKNQLGSTGQANLGKFRTAEGVDPANVPVQPVNVLKEDDEPETDSPEHEAGETPAQEKAEHEPGGDEFIPKENEKGDFSFAPDAQVLGSGVVKPDGAPTTGVDITVQPDKTVNIAMNESEKRLRKYVRARLEEKAGLRKPVLNENKKSETLKKLDKVIDEQYKLYESVVVKKKVK